MIVVSLASMQGLASRGAGGGGGAEGDGRIPVAIAPARRLTALQREGPENMDVDAAWMAFDPVGQDPRNSAESDEDALWSPALL